MSDSLQTAIDQLRQDVAQQTTVTQSAVTLIGGIPALIQDAIAKAQAAGASTEQLQALHDLDAAVQASSQALAQAVSANTPANGGQADGQGGGQPVPSNAQPDAPANAPTDATTTDQDGQPTGAGNNPPSV